MTERYLTPSDLSQRYAVPVKTIHTWRYKGVGPPALKIGRHLRWRESDLLAWEQQRQEAR